MIRPASEHDYPVIARLHTASWQENYTDWLDADLLANRVPEMHREHWAKARPSPGDIFLVAESEGLDGFVVAYRREDALFVDNLHVRKGVRSGRIGERLMAEMAARGMLQGAQSSYLYVAESNRRARAFYARIGGHEAEFGHKDHFGEPKPVWRVDWTDLGALAARPDFALERFVDAQGPIWGSVIAELEAGHKRTHWMWFVFPQITGLSNSEFGRRYAISGIAEARAYLRHAALGPRLLEALDALSASHQRDAAAVLGKVDAAKLRSCLTLFEHVATDPAPFAAALQRYFGSERDPATLARL